MDVISLLDLKEKNLAILKQKSYSKILSLYTLSNWTSH
jgi:hypothetical protein